MRICDGLDVRKMARGPSVYEFSFDGGETWAGDGWYCPWVYRVLDAAYSARLSAGGCERASERESEELVRLVREAIDLPRLWAPDAPDGGASLSADGFYLCGKKVCVGPWGA